MAGTLIDMKLDVKGWRRELEAAIRRKRRKFADAVKATALDVQHDARSEVPVDTGSLKGSIQLLDTSLNGLTVEVGSALEYADRIETGTPVGTGPHGGPRPYLKPAVEKNKRKLDDRVRRILDE